jgi:hypothetical protein
MAASIRSTAEGFRVGYRVLALLLGLLTLATFTVERSLETGGASLGELPAIVLGGVMVAVALGSFHAARRDARPATGLLLPLGPVAGFWLYLAGYHLVRPPSSDSPTWLLFAGFAGAFLATGLGGYAAGRLVVRLRRG